MDAIYFYYSVVDCLVSRIRWNFLKAVFGKREFVDSRRFKTRARGWRALFCSESTSHVQDSKKRTHTHCKIEEHENNLIKYTHTQTQSIRNVWLQWSEQFDVICNCVVNERREEKIYIKLESKIHIETRQDVLFCYKSDFYVTFSRYISTFFSSFYA